MTWEIHSIMAADGLRHDWVIWLRSDGGRNLKLQAGYQVTLAEMAEIVGKFIPGMTANTLSRLAHGDRRA